VSWGWLPAVLVLGGLIFLHELGHFVAARACRVEVEEFSLGFGPKLAGVRRGATLYALRLIPVLGYVRMAGMYPIAPETLRRDREQDGEGEADPSRGALAEALRSQDANARGVGFASKPLAQRVLIIAAGPITNFLVALVLYAAVFGAVGLPLSPTLQVRSVEPGSPAAQAGIRPGDTVEAVDGNPVQGWQDLHQAIVADSAAAPGGALAITLVRAGRRLTLAVTPQAGPNGPMIGVVPVMQSVRLSAPRAAAAGLAQTGASIYQSLAAVVSLIVNAVLRHQSQAQLMGPIGIGSQIDLANQAGPAVLMLLAALLSANLGLLNLLPVPALDGGRLAFLGVEWLRGGRPVDPAKEGMVHFIGLAVLMAFILLVSMHDIANLG
jgi:regulator of sigma E protease